MGWATDSFWRDCGVYFGKHESSANTQKIDPQKAKLLHSLYLAENYYHEEAIKLKLQERNARNLSYEASILHSEFVPLQEDDKRLKDQTQIAEQWLKEHWEENKK